jgi:hypothetical protein
MRPTTTTRLSAEASPGAAWWVASAGVDLPPQQPLEQVARFLVGEGAQAGDLAHVGLGRVGGEVVGQLRGPPRQFERRVAGEAERHPFGDRLLPEGVDRDPVGVQHLFQADPAAHPLAHVLGDVTEFLAVEVGPGLERRAQHPRVARGQRFDVGDPVRRQPPVDGDVGDHPLDHQPRHLVEALAEARRRPGDLGVADGLGEGRRDRLAVNLWIGGQLVRNLQVPAAKVCRDLL